MNLPVRSWTVQNKLLVIKSIVGKYVQGRRDDRKDGWCSQGVLGHVASLVTLFFGASMLVGGVVTPSNRNEPLLNPRGVSRLSSGALTFIVSVIDHQPLRRRLPLSVAINLSTVVLACIDRAPL